MLQQRTILVIENDPQIGPMLIELLVTSGYHAYLLTAAQGALEQIRKLQPDLLITDVWLEQPRSGWRLLETLQASPMLGAIPALITSAHVWMAAEMMSGFPQPHYQFLNKPYDIEQLLRLIAQLLDQRLRLERTA